MRFACLLLLCACVSDNPGSGSDAGPDVKNHGGDGQPCYENQTCDPGLTCVAGKICVVVDAGQDAADAADAATAVDAQPDAVEAGAMVPCNGNLNCERYVFVTSTLFKPSDLGGLTGIEGADTACATAAATNGTLAGRTWQAWLGTYTNTVKTRLSHGTKPYRRLDGTIVANSWTDLTDGSLAATISIDESGTALAFSFKTWTGSGADGSITSNDCSGWTDNSGGVQGVQGSPAAMDVNWSISFAAPCNDTARIYCMEK